MSDTDTQTPDLEVLPAGHVAVPRAEFDVLQAAFQAGNTATSQISTMRFNAAFRAAVSEGRAVPALEEITRRIFAKDQDLAIELIAAFPKFVNVKPLGAGANDTPEAPDGVDPQHYALHLKAQAYQREHNGVDYLTALDRVSEEGR